VILVAQKDSAAGLFALVWGKKWTLKLNTRVRRKQKEEKKTGRDLICGLGGTKREKRTVVLSNEDPKRLLNHLPPKQKKGRTLRKTKRGKDASSVVV